MTLSDKMIEKKARFPEVLRDSLGIVTNACLKLKIGRPTYYKWCREDPEFNAACDAVQEYTMDFVEGKLLELINEKHPAAIIFYAKTKGKNRGYVERMETTGAGGGAIKNEVEVLSGPDLETFERYRARERAKGVAEFKETQGV
jgi:hypothetical protein